MQTLTRLFSAPREAVGPCRGEQCLRPPGKTLRRAERRGRSGAKRRLRRKYGPSEEPTFSGCHRCENSRQPPALAHACTHSHTAALGIEKQHLGNDTSARPPPPHTQAARPLHVPQAVPAQRSQHRSPARDRGDRAGDPVPLQPPDWGKPGTASCTPPGSRGVRCAKRANPGCVSARGTDRPRPLAPRSRPHRFSVSRLPVRSQSANRSAQTGSLLLPGAAAPRRRPQCPGLSPCAPARRSPRLAVHTRGHAGCLSRPTRTPAPTGRPPPDLRPLRRSPIQTPLVLPGVLPGGYARRAYSPQELDLVLALARIGHGSRLLVRRPARCLG